jgi:uncharacterized protein YbjT (DUF2867 family)
MAKTELLVVLGATGLQGGSVIDHVQKQLPHIKIRGTTRDTKSSKSQDLVKRGVEMVAADMNDKEALIAAFQVCIKVHVDEDRSRSDLN